MAQIQRMKTSQYAVCYNTNTLIPEFTGHVLKPFEPQAGGRDEWAIDRTFAKLFSILLVYFCVCVCFSQCF